MYEDDFARLPQVYNTLYADGTPNFTHHASDMQRFNSAHSGRWGQMVVNHSSDAWRSFYCPNLAPFLRNKPRYFTNASMDAIGYIPWQWAK